jgi:hypothetical protein
VVETVIGLTAFNFSDQRKAASDNRVVGCAPYQHGKTYQAGSLEICANERQLKSIVMQRTRSKKSFLLFVVG